MTGLKKRQDIFLDTEFLTPQKAADIIHIHPISIGLVTYEGDDGYYAAFKEARKRETKRLILADEWIRANVWRKLPGAGDPLWKTRTQIQKDITDFILRHPAKRVNIWTKGGTGYDNVIAYKIYGDVAGFRKKLLNNDSGIEFIDFPDTMLLRKFFGKVVSSAIIKKEIEDKIGAETYKKREHTADFDAWLEKEVFRSYQYHVPEEQFKVFENGFPAP